MEVQNLEKTQQQNSYQAAGGRSTYYKRYLYRDALEIEEDDDVEPMTGAPEIKYQAPEEVTPYQFETPQASTIQQENIIKPEDNITPEPKKKTTKASSDAVLSQESRDEPGIHPGCIPDGMEVAALVFVKVNRLYGGGMEGMG